MAPLEERPDLSVILCTRDGALTIRGMLDSLCRQQAGPSWELVVVDNGSTDATWDILAEYEDRLPIRRFSEPEKSGLGFARNRGVDHSRAERICFIDDDDELDERWIVGMHEALIDAPLVGSTFQYERLTAPSTMRGRSRFQSDRLESIFGYLVVSGGGLGCWRQVWEAVDGNDESLTQAGEDTDFALRVHLELGIEPTLARSAIYHYRQRGGLRGSFRQGRRYGVAHVMLYKRYGVGRVDRRAEARRACRDWWWILTRSPLLVARNRRSAWSRRVGMRVGRIIGSVQHRHLLP